MSEALERELKRRAREAMALMGVIAGVAFALGAGVATVLGAWV
jgi:hypothetical protein